MEKQSQNFDVIVVGGGASGMMAAGICASEGRKVLLLEKNSKLGEKLKITGGKRCNITNATFDVRTFLKKYGESEKFLHSTFSQFSAKDTFSFFESNGLPLVTQARNRVFPKTEKAMDVFLLLERLLKQKGVTVLSGTGVTKIESKEGLISGVMTKKGLFKAKDYILATGGQSHPETGSTGDGFKWLKSLGHSVSDPSPSIVPLAVKDSWVKKLSGISVPNASITFFVNEKRKFKKVGKILFTHFGLSGPHILNSASQVSDLLHEGIVTAKMDLYPLIDHGDLEKKILKVFDANKNKILKNVFKEIVPDGTKDVLLSLISFIDENKKVHSVTKDERKKIVHILKSLDITIEGLMGFDRAVVADGGVSLKEINTKTMQSNLFPNLFVTGDLLNINRPSGGYSLQLCWSTGYVAGINAGKS
jgi:predicted Rossmann fold flavoprotein